jgi:hypothetical protein
VSVNLALALDGVLKIHTKVLGTDCEDDRMMCFLLKTPYVLRSNSK